MGIYQLNSISQCLYRLIGFEDKGSVYSCPNFIFKNAYMSYFYKNNAYI